MSGVSKVKKKSNLELLLLELFEAEKEILDQNPDPEIISAGHPGSGFIDGDPDDEMASWLASEYGINEASFGLKEQLEEETFENVEENTATGISIKI